MVYMIELITKGLSDGSLAYDVKFGTAELHAVTEDDALALVNKLEAAIAAHTVDETAVCVVAE